MEKEKCQKCGSTNIILIEYGLLERPDADKYYYDGISEINCNKCGVRIGRWSGKVLGEGELELRFGVL